MAKLQKTETDYRYYEFELTDEQYEMYKDDKDAFWDEVDPEWEYVGDNQGKDEIELID